MTLPYACGKSKKRRVQVIDIGGGLSVDYNSDVAPSFIEYVAAIEDRCPSFREQITGIYCDKFVQQIS